MIVSARQSWPLAADYSKMLQHPELAFKNPELQQCLIETMHGNNQPRPRAGAFAVVYRARYPGSDRHVAVRAFTKESKERQHRYHAIREYLRGRKLECLVDFDYSDQGIRSTDGRFYPLVTMEWVQGDALFEWVEARCLVGDRDALTQACEDWIALIDELQSNEIAHGDLQHGNIMVTPDHQLKLVDYDCMCVPSLIGQPNLEIVVGP